MKKKGVAGRCHLHLGSTLSLVMEGLGVGSKMLLFELRLSGVLC